MSRWIDADALKENFTCDGEEWINNIIDDEPSIDIVRKRGEWKKNKTYKDIIFCSECGEPFQRSSSMGCMNFCSNCGADMRGDEPWKMWASLIRTIVILYGIESDSKEKSDEQMD